MRGHFRIVFQGQSNIEVRLTMTVQTADLNLNFTVSFDPVDRFQHVRGHFGVVFHGQSNGEVTVHISSHGRRHLHNILSSVWMSTCQGSI